MLKNLMNTVITVVELVAAIIIVTFVVTSFRNNYINNMEEASKHISSYEITSISTDGIGYDMKDETGNTIRLYPDSELVPVIKQAAQDALDAYGRWN